MAWEVIERCVAKKGTAGIYFSSRKENGRAATAVRLGPDEIEFLGVKQGDFAEVLMDFDAKKIGFRKATKVNAGFKLQGKHQTLTLKFSTPKNRYASMLLPLYGKIVDFERDGKIAVVKVER